MECAHAAAHGRSRNKLRVPAMWPNQYGLQHTNAVSGGCVRPEDFYAYHDDKSRGENDILLDSSRRDVSINYLHQDDDLLVILSIIMCTRTTDQNP